MPKTIIKNQSGLAHLGLLLLGALVLAGVGFSVWRVNSTNKTRNNSVNTPQVEQVKPLPQDISDLKTLDEVSQIAGATNSTSIIKFVLESKDGKYVYNIILSNGKKLVIDASTGQVLSEETTKVSEDDKIPAGIQITVSLADAYKIASSKSSSPIKTIEMEVEDKKVVYKIEYQDGSKIEIDASGGGVIKSEIKGESEQENDEEKDDENENEDSDDSQDSEDHAEEDR